MRYSWLLIGLCMTAPAAAQDDFEKRASWEIPAVAEIRGELMKLAKESDVDEVVQLKLETLWPDQEEQVPSSQLLMRLCDSAGLLDERAKAVVKICNQAPSNLIIKSPAILADEEVPELLRNNLRLLFGRWLGQNRFYDASLEALDGLEPGDVVMMGTPSGVGHARKPPLWMRDGDTVEIEIEGIGILRNPIQDDVAS